MNTGAAIQPPLSLTEIAENFRASALKILAQKYQAIATKPLCIWGTSIFGRTVRRILEECGYGEQLKCFINSFHVPEKPLCIDGLAELDPATALKAYPQAVLIIASDYFAQIEAKVRKLKVTNPVFRILSSQYSNQLEKMLRFYYFAQADSQHPLDVVGDIHDWFAYYAQLRLDGSLTKQQQTVSAYLEDEESRRCLNMLVDFYTSGDLQLLIDSKAKEQQYFSPLLYPLTDEEVILDCGAFIGDTIAAFTRLKAKYARIFAFEPDPKNVSRLTKFIENHKLANITVVSAAVGQSSGQMAFSMQGTQGGRLISTTETDSQVKVIKLDDYCAQAPTLIKMDIEGGELEALKGAQQLIKAYKPKLAICVYHRPEDLFTIPGYLKELNPGYHFKLRKHSSTVYETVLYAY